MRQGQGKLSFSSIEMFVYMGSRKYLKKMLRVHFANRLCNSFCQTAMILYLYTFYYII